MIVGPAAELCADLRAEIARRQVVLYKLAADIKVHPGRLGMMLNGKVPLPSHVAEKIVENLKGLQRTKQVLHQE